MQPQTDHSFPIETRIAKHFVSTTWAELPAASRANAVRAILWWLGTGLEGVAEEHHAKLSRYAEMQADAKEASILGSRVRVTAELAGLVNGRAGKAWEHEDKYWVDESIGFGVGCCVVPAALAAAQARGGVGGTALATAVALAIDFEIRLLRPLGLGFVPGKAVANATFTLGAYGAAAAAAKILGLNQSAFLDALGLAHCQASGNFQGQVEGRGVALQAGLAVQSGVASARMAAIGMPGPKGSLTGRCGLYAMHYPLCMVNTASIVDRLGEDYLNIHQGFKGYPCGVVAHPVIDAVLALRPSLQGRRIQAIDIFGSNSLAIMASPIERKRAPNSIVEAQFSIPWAAACALRDGHFSITHYEDAALRDAALRRLASLVSVHMSDEHRGTSVRITLSDEAVLLSPTVMGSRGSPANPLPTQEIEDMLHRAAHRLGLKRTSVQQAITLLHDPEALKDCGEIMALLSEKQA